MVTRHYFITSDSFNANLLFHILDSGSNTGIVFHFDKHLLSSIYVSSTESPCSIPAKQNIRTVYIAELRRSLTLKLTLSFQSPTELIGCGTFQTYCLCKGSSPPPSQSSLHFKDVRSAHVSRMISDHTCVTLWLYLVYFNLPSSNPLSSLFKVMNTSVK